MTKTMEALDKFAQALPATPAPQDRSSLRAAEVPAAEVTPPSDRPAFTTARAEGAGEKPGPLRVDVLPDLAPPAASCDARSQADSGQGFSLPFAFRAGATRTSAARNSPPMAAMSRGTTRRGSHSEWPRLIGMAMLAVTIGIGFKLLVRASERAGEAHWRDGVAKFLAHRHHSAGRSRSSGA
jgi:hypothetical protein